jgi:mannose-6-phosphate isomerase-like protein (cupin superfamily)
MPLDPMVGDPDDYRPNSSWKLITDDPSGAIEVDDIAIIVEQVAPGDSIPLHIHHEVNECVLVIQGRNEIRIADDVLLLEPGDAVFVPKGTPHAQRNVGDEPLMIHAIFPATVVDMELLERNPAPGTEGQSPKHTVYDLRTGDYQER